jgi:hypothetical protein
LWLIVAGTVYKTALSLRRYIRAIGDKPEFDYDLEQKHFVFLEALVPLSVTISRKKSGGFQLQSGLKGEILSFCHHFKKGKIRINLDFIQSL